MVKDEPNAATAFAVDAGRRAADAIAGPGLGDTRAHLCERIGVFAARLAAFRSAVGVEHAGRLARAASTIDLSKTCRACGLPNVRGGVCATCGAAKGVDDGAGNAE